jgi:hypothetical protein
MEQPDLEIIVPWDPNDMGLLTSFLSGIFQRLPGMASSLIGSSV